MIRTQQPRLINHLAVQSEELDILLGCLAFNPSFRGLWQRKFSRLVFNHDFPDGSQTEISGVLGCVQCLGGLGPKFCGRAAQPDEGAGIEQQFQRIPHSAISFFVRGAKASSGICKGGEVSWPTGGLDFAYPEKGTSLATGRVPRRMVISSPCSTWWRTLERCVFALWMVILIF